MGAGRRRLKAGHRTGLAGSFGNRQGMGVVNRKSHQITPHLQGPGSRLVGAVAMLVIALPLTLYWSQRGPGPAPVLAVDPAIVDALTGPQVLRAQFFWPFGGQRTRRSRIKKTIRKKPVQATQPKRVAPTGALVGPAQEDKTATRIVVFEIGRAHV